MLIVIDETGDDGVFSTVGSNGLTVVCSTLTELPYFRLFALCIIHDRIVWLSMYILRHISICMWLCVCEPIQLNKIMLVDENM